MFLPVSFPENTMFMCWPVHLMMYDEKDGSAVWSFTEFTGSRERLWLQLER